MAIAVDARGRVALKAPPDTPLERLDRIVHQKARWILERQKQRRREEPHPAAHYMIVHELAHLGEREHSPAFWSIVGRALPDYEQRRAALKRLGPELVW